MIKGIKIDTVFFGKGLNAYMAGMQKLAIPKFLMETAFAYKKIVIDLTPVDTGRLRAGWHLSSRARSTSKKAKNPYVNIFNRVEYVLYVEFGTSKMAPRGMARKAMLILEWKLRSGGK